MKCYSLSIGSGTTGGRRRFTRDADRLVRTITQSHFPDGFTIVEAAGGWFDPRRGRFLREESRQVIVSADRVTRLDAWCAQLAEALKQEELLVIELGPRHRFRLDRPCSAGPRTPGRRKRLSPRP